MQGGSCPSLTPPHPTQGGSLPGCPAGWGPASFPTPGAGQSRARARPLPAHRSTPTWAPSAGQGQGQLLPARCDAGTAGPARAAPGLAAPSSGRGGGGRRTEEAARVAAGKELPPPRRPEGGGSPAQPGPGRGLRTAQQCPAPAQGTPCPHPLLPASQSGVWGQPPAVEPAPLNHPAEMQSPRYVPQFYPLVKWAYRQPGTPGGPRFPSTFLTFPQLRNGHVASQMLQRPPQVPATCLSFSCL